MNSIESKDIKFGIIINKLNLTLKNMKLYISKVKGLITKVLDKKPSYFLYLKYETDLANGARMFSRDQQKAIRIFIDQQDEYRINMGKITIKTPEEYIEELQNLELRITSTYKKIQAEQISKDTKRKVLQSILDSL